MGNGAVFAEAQMERAVLAQSAFPAADFRDVDLTLADMRLGEFQGANFDGADLTAVNASYADFEGATGVVVIADTFYRAEDTVRIYGTARGGNVVWGFRF
jgi:uncharacterized protein YjbI with pentapeptide repeats